MMYEDIATLERDPSSAWITESASISPDRESDLLAIDPRPCQMCGLTIDRHEMVDDGEGPVFFCADLSPDEMTLQELERRAELVRQIEIAAILAAMEWPAFVPPPPRQAEPYRPPQSTIEAFWYVAGLDDADYLKRWLAQHPRDVETLQKLWEAKHAGA
jgi:hypothetical protein